MARNPHISPHPRAKDIVVKPLTPLRLICNFHKISAKDPKSPFLSLFLYNASSPLYSPTSSLHPITQAQDIRLPRSPSSSQDFPIISFSLLPSKYPFPIWHVVSSFSLIGSCIHVCRGFSSYLACRRRIPRLACWEVV